jgi:hypothetical protein
MATVGNLRDRILRLVDDPSGIGYNDIAIRDALASAQDAILPWIPKLQTSTIVGTGASSYLLPTELYEVQSVVDVITGQSLNRATLSPNSYHGDTIEATNDWILYPSGYISFSKELAVGINYTLYYTARYNELDDPLNTLEVIEPPSWTIVALCYYAASILLVPEAVSASTIRQFNTRVDSGTPEHNPMQKSVTFLQNLFIQEMNRNPKFQKVSP